MYPKPGNSRVHTCILQFSNQINTESKNLQPELFWGKTCVSIHSQTVCDKGERDQNLAFNLVILVRIPQNFLYKSRVLHLVCTPTGYIQERGPPVVLTFCFSKLYLCRQLWMEMEIMLVLYSGIFISKGLLKCYTESRALKILFNHR